jgi:shikimate dehydrogenase
MKYAVMGNPIAHSLSPGIHRQFAQSAGLHLDYERILVESDFEFHVRHFFKTGGHGLNITAPYKAEAFALSDVPTRRCQDAKAANTLWMKEGKMYADNTDGIGLCRSLSHHVNLAHARMLIIGAGGAARGIIKPLLESHAQIIVTNRTLEKAHELQDAFLSKLDVISLHHASFDFDVILNAATFNLDTKQLPTQWLKNKPLCYDLAYHQSGITPFVTWGRLHGCEAQDGYDMLVEQAAESFFIWHGVRVPVSFNRLQVLIES